MFNKIRDIFKQVYKSVRLPGRKEQKQEKKPEDRKKKRDKKPKKPEKPESEPKNEPVISKPKKSKLAKAIENQLDKFRKIEITKQEAYRRMGIKDESVYTVGNKEISAKDIDKYLKQHGYDMTEYFLGNTADFKYNKKTYRKQQSRFADKISQLAKDKSLDQDYVDALTVMMLGSDIAFDYTTVYK